MNKFVKGDVLSAYITDCSYVGGKNYEKIHKKNYIHITFLSPHEKGVIHLNLLLDNYKDLLN